MTQIEDTKYLYVLVRKDLFPASQIAVQSAHAVIEAVRAFSPGQDQEHPHLVLLSVDNQEEIIKAYHRLLNYGIKTVKFHEPDQNNEVTAIATEPLSINSNLRRKFSCYKLLDLDSVKNSENSLEGGDA